MVNCSDLLRANAKKGGIKKVHCDAMIKEAIELIDQLEEKYKLDWLANLFLFTFHS